MLWGPRRTRGSDTYEGRDQPGFPRDRTGQRDQDCPHRAHSRSPDRRPWHHQTGPHLPVGKEIREVPGMWVAQNSNKNNNRKSGLPEGLPVLGEGSLAAPIGAILSEGAENGSTTEAVNAYRHTIYVCFCEIHDFIIQTLCLQLSCVSARMHTPVVAGKPHARPVELRLEILFCGASQGSTGGRLCSHGGGGLLEGGGAIHEDSALEVLELPSSRKGK